MNSPLPTPLSEEQLAFYRDNEYLVLRNVIPESLLDGIQASIERWVGVQIQEWIDKGKLDKDYSEYPFETRLMHAWNDAGHPRHTPNPTVEIASREIYEVLTYPLFIDICKQLFATHNITASGGFHCRPDLPHQPFTDTPWHQDAQCIPGLAGTQFAIFWIPLMDVDEHNGCLETAGGRQHEGMVYKKYQHPVGHYISMHPDDAEQLQHVDTLRMKRGDLLFFNELCPHRAVPNESDQIRWSLDLRYHPVDNKVVADPHRSFTCAHEDPSQVEGSLELWMERMQQPLVIQSDNPE